MNNLEKNAVRVVAKLAPWLAPLPSAYFVARSAMIHLALPLPVAIVVAAIIETLGLATVHTALWAYDWNAHKRKTDPTAPTGLAVALGKSDYHLRGQTTDIGRPARGVLCSPDLQILKANGLLGYEIAIDHIPVDKYLHHG